MRCGVQMNVEVSRLNPGKADWPDSSTVGFKTHICLFLLRPINYLEIVTSILGPGIYESSWGLIGRLGMLRGHLRSQHEKKGRERKGLQKRCLSMILNTHHPTPSTCSSPHPTHTQAIVVFWTLAFFL